MGAPVVSHGNLETRETKEGEGGVPHHVCLHFIEIFILIHAINFLLFCHVGSNLSNLHGSIMSDSDMIDGDRLDASFYGSASNMDVRGMVSLPTFSSPNRSSHRIISAVHFE